MDIVVEVVKLLVGVALGSFVGGFIVMRLMRWQVRNMVRDVIRELKSDGESVEKLKEIGRTIARGMLEEFRSAIQISLPDPPKLEELLRGVRR